MMHKRFRNLKSKFPPKTGQAVRTLTVGVEGFASGLPLMTVSKLLQGWLTALGIPIEMVGLLGLIELPYTLKLFWAPLMDKWAIPWPDSRRGWIAILQILIGINLIAFISLNPNEEPLHLFLVGVAALLVAILSASQDVVVDAYRTDLLPEKERGGGAAAASLGYRLAMLFIGAGGFFIAGIFGWRIAFLLAGILMLAISPFTLLAPKLTQIENSLPTLREAVLGPAYEFVGRTGKRKAIQLLTLVLLYRWPDGLLSLMSVPFLIQAGFTPELIGAIQGGWGIAATMLGTATGGILFSKLGLNKALWIYGIVGAISNLAYWALAHFGGTVQRLLIAVTVENFCSGMMVSAFLALLMSLCNPKFSASQYALLSGIYALSRSLLSTPGGFVANQIGWSSFFALSMATAVPSFLLMTIVTPWKEAIPRGAFDPKRDSTNYQLG